MRVRKIPKGENKRCDRCGVYKKIEFFKSIITGKEVGSCTNCQRYTKKLKVAKRYKTATPLANIFKKNRVRFKKGEPYCMRCGKPFRYTIKSAKAEKSTVIKRDEPLNWNYWKEFILCDACFEDKLAGKKFNLFHYKDYRDGVGILVKEGVGIEDMSKEDRKIIYIDYPYNKLKGYATNKSNNLAL